MQTQKDCWISIPSCCHSFWWLTSVDSSSVNGFAAGPFPPSAALTYMPCKGAVTSSGSPHLLLHGPHRLKLDFNWVTPLLRNCQWLLITFFFFFLNILKSRSALPGSPHLPFLPLQLPHHSTSSTQDNPTLPRQVLGFSQGFIFSRLSSLQQIFLPHLFPTSPLSSIQFSCSVVSNSLWLHEPQHARPPCPSPTPRVHPNPCPLSQWCHPTISSSVVPFSSCPQSFPALGSFQMSQLFTSGGQSIGASASALVLPVNILGWFPLGLTGLISFLQGTV